MWTEVSPSNHAGEDIHEQRDIDEAVLEADIGDVAHPDLIASTDFKRFEVVPPRLRSVSGVGRLTRTFDANRQVLFFHQAGDAFIPNGVSFSHQHLRDASIPVGRVSRRSSMYFGSQHFFRCVNPRLIIEGTLVETQHLTNLAHGILLAQCLNETALLRRHQSK